MTLPDGTHRDSYCKILPLGESLVFFHTGITIATNASTGSQILDARELARQAATEIAGPLEQIVNRWAELMIESFDQLENRHGHLSTGFFAGVVDASLVLYAVDIDFDGSQFVAKRTLINPGDKSFRGIGHFKGLEEFSAGGRTDRAKAVWREVETKTIGQSDLMWRALLYHRIAESVVEWGNEKGNGGEIATLIFERGKKWRWFRRPDFCPEK